MTIRKLLAATAVVGFGTVWGVTGAFADTEGKGPRALVTCSGLSQEFVGSNTQNAPVSTASAAFVAIPDTTIPGGASGPAGDFDLYVVTFAGEAAATGGGFWQAQAQVSINGGAFTAINPNGPNTFHKGNKAETNSMTWCARLAATVSTTFRIVWAKSGGGTANLDDYLIVVQRSN